ncbi:MAG: hypothetical protein ACXVB9_01320 [Bdellovibrionota bacterium]
MMLVALYILASVARASPAELAAVEAACDAPQKIEEKVSYCSENTEAVASATRCKNALKKMWDNAPRDVDPAFAKLFQNNDGKQQLNFKDSHTDYQTTMTNLSSLVGVTQDKADFVAQYPVVMVDYPGASDDPSLSAPCYNEEVDKIQAIVNEMDKMILQGKATYAEAGNLRGIGVARDDHIDSTLGADLVRGLASAPARPAAPRGGPSSSSGPDITGTVQNQEKEVLGAFVLRNQLTGP